jgi:transposase
VIAPHLPKPCVTGRPREWPMREIINGIFYVMRAGCPRRLLPNDLPPWGTIYRWFAAWRDDGRFERINHALVMADRERIGRDASSTAAIIDSQSAKTTEAGGPRGYDAGRRSTDVSALLGLVYGLEQFHRRDWRFSRRHPRLQSWRRQSRRDSKRLRCATRRKLREVRRFLKESMP